MRHVFLIIGTLIFGCSTRVQPSELAYLSGYWVIEEVISKLTLAFEGTQGIVFHSIKLTP